MTCSLLFLRLNRIILFLVLAAVTALTTVFCLPAESNEVIVIKSADLKPYQEVLRGVMDTCDSYVYEVKLRNGEGPEKILLKSPDAVLAIGTSAFIKVRKIKNLPLIYTMVLPSQAALFTDPNISGVSLDIAPAAYMSAMKQLFPRSKKIALLYDPRYTGAFVKEASNAAHAEGFELIAKPVHDSSQIPAAFNDMREKPDVLWMIPDVTLISQGIIDYMLHYSFGSNVPIFSFSRKYVEMGAVASLDVDPYDIGVQAGEIINALSSGNPGAIRLYARKSNLIVNTKMARKMGLAFSAEIMKKAIQIE